MPFTLLILIAEQVLSMNKNALPSGFCYVRDLIPDIIEDIRYASEDNFVGAPVDGYFAPRAILTLEAAQALKSAAEDFRLQGLRLMIFDAYRPTRAVAHFLRWAKDKNDTVMREEYYPDIANKADILRRGYVAEQSSHSRGSTVDLTLTGLNGEALPMGTDFDFFGERAGHGAAGISAEETHNRALLCKFMLAAGFKPYQEEWWHYTLKNEPYPETYFDFTVQ